jgi:hypothetical protein
MNRYILLVVAAGVLFWPVSGALAASDGDACAMLQKVDVEAAFAPRTFDSGKPGFAMKASKSNAAVSSCTYTSKDAMARDRVTVSLKVRRAPSDETGITPAAAKDGAAQLKARPVDVPAAGQGAYWVSLGSSALPSIQLNVFRGKRDWLIFSSSARTLDNDAVLAGLTKVAKATAVR